ncbi:hypothetical protein ASE16_02695 [Leifsonia sp. Root227]|nr:hypothetical protein ASE16_02695 [Leifsonia sp. Root227]
MSAVVVLSATMSMTVLWRRDVIDAKLFAYRTLVNVALPVIGIFNAVWAVNPLWHEDLLRGMQSKLAGQPVAGFNSLEALPFLALQLLGEIVTVVTLLTAIAFSMAAVSAIYIKQNAAGPWFWKFWFWTSKWSVKTVVSCSF